MAHHDGAVGGAVSDALAFVLLVLATAPCLLAYSFQIYQFWGDPPEVRVRAALLSSNLSWFALLLVVVAAFATYSGGLRSHGWKVAALTVAYVLIGGLSAARIVWIQGFVLPP